VRLWHRRSLIAGRGTHSVALSALRMTRSLARVALLAVGILAGGSCRRSEVVASLGRSAHLVGAFDGRVYWTEGETLRWSDGGDAPAPAFAIEGVDWASRESNFTADATDIFFSHHNRVAQLEREPRAAFPGADESIGIQTRMAGEQPSGVAIDGDCVYTLQADVDCQDRGKVLALPRTPGGSCAGRDVPANGLQPVEFGMDAERYYWIDGSCPFEGGGRLAGRIQAIGRRAGAAVVIAHEEASDPKDLHVGRRGIYWRTRAGLRFVPGDRLTAPVTLVPGEVTGLAVHETALFFLRRDGVYFLPPGGAEPRRLAEEQGPRDLVVDRRFLYWIGTEKRLNRLPRP
jgi:hypothetical protein